MKAKLFDYTDRDNFIFNLSGLTKLFCFIFMTFSVMFSYDIRYILFGGIVQVFASGMIPLMRNRGASFYAMCSMAAGCITNIVLDYLFQFD